MTQTIFTIGHSSRSIDGFTAMLNAFEIKTLVDIRTVPQSRFNPQFGLVSLAKSLKQMNILYIGMKSLGGKRQPLPDSINTAFRSDGFRGYADYMQTDEFAEALRGLIKIAEQSGTAIMCAEGNPVKCHRFLVSDALMAKNMEVKHIMSIAHTENHTMTEDAVVEGTITYPGKLERQRSLF